MAHGLHTTPIMSNTRVGVLIGSGVATGAAVICVALIYAAKTRRRNQTLLARTRKQAEILKHQASKLRDAAADFIEKGREEAERKTRGIMEAVEAGKAKYQRVAG
jgi:hypothetical protein